MFKLELVNIGSGFQTLGRGELGMGPLLGLTRKSAIALSAVQFKDYEKEIRYFHTKHCGEIKMQLLVDGEITTPDDVSALCSAGDISDVPISDEGQIYQTVKPEGIAGELDQPEDVAETTALVVKLGERAAL